MLPTMKNLPLSTATTLGSPDHFWLGLVLGNPTKSVKDFPAFRENPTPVREACGSVLGEMKKAEASFQASIRSEEHTSELQSLRHIVCRLLLSKNISASNPSVFASPRRRLTSAAPCPVVS